MSGFVTLCAGWMGNGVNWCEHGSHVTSFLCFLTDCDESSVTPIASPAGPSLGDSALSLLVGWGDGSSSAQGAGGACRAAASHGHP